MLILPELVMSMSDVELKVNADLAAAASSLVVDDDVANNNPVESLELVALFSDGITALNVVSFKFLSLAIVTSPVDASEVAPPALK